VGGQCGNPAVVYPQAFPDGVAALNDAVEDRDTSLRARFQFAVDVNEYVLVT
jgi:hypothetical protein